MPPPTVSIITPCYRQAAFLPAAIDSVLGQSHQPVEMVVVNDGSDDDTPAVAERYRGRITYLEQPNGGQSSARNLGLRHAGGDYVVFLDADDLLHPEAIGWLVNAARGQAQPLCVMGCRAFRDDPNLAEEEWMPPPVAGLLPWFIRQNCGPPHCFMSLTKMVIEAGGFDEELAGCEDWDLWLKLALQGATLVTVSRVGAFYRRHQTSFSSHTPRMLLDRVRVLLRVHRRLLDRPGPLHPDCAAELLDAEHRVRRRCLVQKADAKYVTALSEAIAELESRGTVANRPLHKRLLEGMLGGTASERLTLACCRLFAPRTFASYQQGFM